MSGIVRIYTFRCNFGQRPEAPEWRRSRPVPAAAGKSSPPAATAPGALASPGADRLLPFWMARPVKVRRLRNNCAPVVVSGTVKTILGTSFRNRVPLGAAKLERAVQVFIPRRTLGICQAIIASRGIPEIPGPEINGSTIGIRINLKSVRPGRPHRAHRLEKLRRRGVLGVGPDREFQNSGMRMVAPRPVSSMTYWALNVLPVP